MYGGGGLEAGAVGEKPTAMWGHSEECRVHPGQVRGQADSTTVLWLWLGGILNKIAVSKEPSLRRRGEGEEGR